MREGVTYEQFVAYIEPMIAGGGGIPPIRKIVAALGGSATTVSRHRKRYLDARSEGQETRVPDDIAAGIEAAARRLAGSLWEQAQEKIVAHDLALAEREAEIEAEADRRVAAAEAALAEVRSALAHERRVATARATLRAPRQAHRTIAEIEKPRRSTRRPKPRVWRKNVA